MPSSRTQSSYSEIRQRLLEGEFLPGTRLDFKRLAGELGVSTTPVREAVGQLASEGLLQLVPRLGAIVPTLSREETTELYGVREAIETHAVVKAAEQITARELTELRHFVERMEAVVARLAAGKAKHLEGAPLREFLSADLAFHMTIIEAAGNRRLTKLAADSHAHAQIFAADRTAHERALVEESQRQHHQILAALTRRDGERARTLVALHLQQSLERALAAHQATPSADRWWRAA